MATAGEVIQEARDVMREFDLGFLPTNQELWRRLSREERSLLDSLVKVAQSGFEFPGDGSGNVDISTWSESYANPATFWRHRHVMLNFAAGGKTPVQLVPYTWEQNLPPVEPAMFFRGGSFYPIDGVTDGMASSRSLGWADADSVDIDFITEPTAKTADADTLDAPDPAVRYLGYRLASWMATRAKAASQTVQQIRADARDARAELFEEVSGYPGPANAPMV